MCDNKKQSQFLKAETLGSKHHQGSGVVGDSLNPPKKIFLMETALPLYCHYQGYSTIVLFNLKTIWSINVNIGLLFSAVGKIKELKK